MIQEQFVIRFCTPKYSALQGVFFPSAMHPRLCSFPCFLSDTFACVLDTIKLLSCLSFFFFFSLFQLFNNFQVGKNLGLFNLIFDFILNACVSPFCLLNSNCRSFWPPLILPANYPEINLFQARMPAVLGSERFFQLPAACHSNGPQLQLRTMSINLPLGRFAQSPHFQQQLPGPHHAPTC